MDLSTELVIFKPEEHAESMPDDATVECNMQTDSCSDNSEIKKEPEEQITNCTDSIANYELFANQNFIDISKSTVESIVSNKEKVTDEVVKKERRKRSLVQTSKNPRRRSKLYTCSAIKTVKTNNKITHKCQICNYVGLKFECLKHVEKHRGKKNWICEVCGFSTTEKYRISYHVNEHTGEKPFSCDWCDIRFFSSYSLTSHNKKYKKIHEGRLKCEKCDYIGISLKDFLIHVKSRHKLKPYKCSLCQHSSKSPRNLEMHMKVHDRKRYYCEHCEYVTLQEKHIVTHMRTHTGEKVFKCETCSLSYATLAKLNFHKVVHNERIFKCDLCTSKYKRNLSLKTHVRIKHSTEKQFKCNLCDYRTSDSGNFKRHTLLHTGIKSYKCDLCDKAFSRSDSLSIHKKKHEENLNSKLMTVNVAGDLFKCNVCKLNFSTKVLLARHITVKHIKFDQHRFKCELCDRFFSSKLGYITHKKAHSRSSLPFKCDICSCFFVNKHALLKHRRNRHSASLRESGNFFNCDLCDFVSETKEGVLSHKNSHNFKSVKCEKCAYVAVNKQGLASHSRSHVDMSEFKCETCNCYFVSLSLLKFHNKVHVVKNGL